MTPSKGYYSIVQFCPDIARGETANIGVVLLVPDRQFLRAKLASDNRHVRHVFGTSGDTLQQLNVFKKSFVERIDMESVRIHSPDALKNFIDTRANFLQLTEPRFVKVRSCDETLEQLFLDLVGPDTKRPTRQSLEEKIAKRFAAAKLEGFLRHNIHVTVPHANRDVRVPFGFQNGKFNLLQVASFDYSNEGQVFRSACVQSMQGRFLQETEDQSLGKLKFNVIGRFASQQDTSVRVVRETLKENSVRLFLESDLSDLFDEIRRTAKPIN